MGNSEWAALLAMCTAVSFSPGPNTTLSTALAANHGLRRALRFCLAVPVGWALLLVLCGAGGGGAAHTGFAAPGGYTSPHTVPLPQVSRCSSRVSNCDARL